MPRQAGWNLTRALVCAVAAAIAAAPVVSAQQDAGRPLAIDASVVDAQGRPVTDLRAAQFSVTIDGAPRAVRSARYVYRGPGAEAAARGGARAGDSASSPLFEPCRTILVVIDETSFPRGAEKPVISATDRLLDRFGPGDHVAVVTVPLPPDMLALTFADDRAAIRDTLARVVGRGASVDLLADIASVSPDVAVTDTTAAGAGAATGAEAVNTTKPVEDSRQEAALAKGQEPEAGARREDPLDTTTRLLAGLRVAPGPKTVILVTAGLADAGRQTDSAARSSAQAVETAAVAARAAIYVLGLPLGTRAASWGELDQLSIATGGDLVRAGRTTDQALDRIGLALSGFYRLELEPSAADRDGRPHTVKVSVARASVTAHAARRIAPRDDPPFFAVAPPPPPVVGASDLPDKPAHAASTGMVRRKGRAPAADPELDTIVARAAEYIAGYFREFRNVVAEEDYVQMVPSARPPVDRRMKSDFLLVTAPDGNTWIPFRDVFEVDGRPIRDREDRLRKLFLESPPGTALEAMARVQDEGSRFNLVSLGRTDINVPTFALTILLDRNIRAFAFTRGREESIDRVALWRVDFEETGRPTLVRGADGSDVPSSGSFWIDPLTGRIVKTFLRAARDTGSDALAGLTLEATVDYRRSDTLGLWVPAAMREAYRLRGNTVEGRATYSKFRSFQVRTEQELKVVKDDAESDVAWR
jgi:VWFA-related protein